ncbi:MAG: RNA methyltransferase [Lentisphaeria bacterium]|nr:RNA methyltransferase [Lentisphaeria bacterium]MBQ7394477.1 RNA methyltransferase [Lentisphaeria bacterium]MBR2642327.1 RNA methyltransferase [Lentisphaeria bacterium]
MNDYPLITSAANPAVKHVVKLRDRRDREREQLTVLEGYRELTRGREYGLEITEVFFAPEMFLGENEMPLLATFASEGARVVQVAPHLLEKMAYRERPEGLIAIARMRRHTLADIPLYPDGFYLVAEAVEKPGNLGSMLRSADAAGVDGMIICNKSTDIYNPNVIRASTGALFSVPLAEATSQEAFDWLKAHKIPMLAATPHAEGIYTDVDMTGPVAIVVGTEQYGLTDLWMNHADLPVRIPMLGKIDSLNVATATTILLYEAARQRAWRQRKV